MMVSGVQTAGDEEIKTQNDGFAEWLVLGGQCRSSGAFRWRWPAQVI
jgi:hypothetical protein